MKCWICFDKCSNICCNCDNDYKYSHKICIIKNSIITNKYSCSFCKNKYKINYFLYYIFYIYLVLSDLLSYDLYNGKKWSDDNFD